MNYDGNNVYIAVYSRNLDLLMYPFINVTLPIAMRLKKIWTVQVQLQAKH